MKRLNKILIILITLCIPVSFSLADKTDCGIFAIQYYSHEGSSNGFDIVNKSRETTTNPYSKFLELGKGEQTAILNKNDLNTALLNLKKYCCENNLGGLSPSFNQCKQDHDFFNDNSLDSPYLFDHLFDVIMRRLNGLTGDSSRYNKTNMSTDEEGEKWRVFITEQAENISGANPQSIIDEYTKTWKQNSDYNMNYSLIRKIYAVFGDESNINFLRYVSGQGGTEESSNIKKALKNYNKRSLLDRYNNACALSEYFYALLSLGQDDNEDKIKTVNYVSKGYCDQKIAEQIQDENIYVKLVIQESANLFLKTYIQGYTQYMQNRANTLKSTRHNSIDRFLDVARGVSQLLKTCVK